MMLQSIGVRIQRVGRHVSNLSVLGRCGDSRLMAPSNIQRRNFPTVGLCRAMSDI